MSKLRKMTPEEVVLYRTEKYRPKGSAYGWTLLKRDAENAAETDTALTKLLDKMAEIFWGVRQ